MGVRDAGNQRIINRKLGEVLGGVGISTLGNTAGTTGTVFGPVVFAGIGGVSLSQSTLGNQATVSISAAVESGIGLAAGTQTMTAGIAILSQLALNSTNGGVVSFGLSNSTVTARVAGAVANLRIVAGALDTTYRATSPVGISNSLQLFMAGNVSHSAIDVDTPGLSIQAVAAAAGTQTATVGTVNFANSNGVSFGLSASSQLTASHNAVSQLAVGDSAGTGVNLGLPRLQFQTSVGANVTFGKSVNANTFIVTANVAAVNVAAGTQTASSGTVAFANSNNITFGLSASSQITASYEPVRLSYLENWRAADLLARDVSNRVGQLIVQRFAVPEARISASQLDFLMNVSNSSSAGATMSLRWAIYTLSGSTASLASSASASYPYNSTLGGSSSYTNVSNWRVYSVPAAWNVTPGDYLIGFNLDIATALTSGTHSIYMGRNSTFLGEPYVAQNYSKYFDLGQVNTNGIPSSIHLSAITQTSASNSDAPTFPWFKLIGTF